MSFKIDDKFKDRLKYLRANSGSPLTQLNLANMLGITSRQVIAYENGTAKPRKELLLKIARLLNVSPSWLACGLDSATTNEYEYFTPTSEVNQIPFYKWSDFDKTLLTFQPFPIINKLTHSCELDAKNSYFALEIVGDAMSLESNLGFPDGSIVTFDAEFDKNSGSFYLLLINGEYSFKQVFFDTLGTRVSSLNKDYPAITLKNNEYHILAKAVYVEVRLR
ncbi:S24 family peptidase [Gilliamella apicola]|uniref:S24 family peptidase n=1 Tax=Gilliamella apicola TaxID=1196095 RepID=UPI0039885DF0